MISLLEETHLTTLGGTPTYCDAPRGVARQRGGSCSSLRSKPFQNESQTSTKRCPRSPKPIQNPSQSLPGPPQNPSTKLFGAHQNRALEANCVQNASHRRPRSIFSIFGPFLEALGPPKMKTKSVKIAKKRLKNNVKTTCVFKHVFQTIFHGFALPKWSQNRCFF